MARVKNSEEEKIEIVTGKNINLLSLFHFFVIFFNESRTSIEFILMEMEIGMKNHFYIYLN